VVRIIMRQTRPTTTRRMPHGNDLQFRQLEFTSALASRRPERMAEIDFSPALSSNFTMSEEMDEYERQAYENAMQYVSALDRRVEKNNAPISLLSDEDLIVTVQRCSLVRSLIEIVAEGGTYPELAKNALASGNLHDLVESKNEAIWRRSQITKTETIRETDEITPESGTRRHQ